MVVNSNSGVSVLMPTYNQGNFIARAVQSLIAQTFRNWELIIINDGCTDNTDQILRKYTEDTRIRYFINERNHGIGYCLNQCLELAKYELISYLPSDDLYFKNHLETLVDTIKKQPDSVLAYSGIRHHYNKISSGIIDGYSLQLVQVLHRKSELKWVERSELVSDDLNSLYWNKLKTTGSFVGSGKITCDWVDHPHQGHKIIREPFGGINLYKQYYKVNEKLKYKSTVGNFIDEIEYYKKFTSEPVNIQTQGKLKILIVGELSYNPERLKALEERGHKLYGLWMREPYWYNNIGPVGGCNIEDIPYENWEEKIREIKPDVIYALLNWQAVPIAHEVLNKVKEIPFIWHFKEGPFICIEKGLWSELVDLHSLSDGQIYTSPEMRDWFGQFVSVDNSHVLDGDLPKKEWFTTDRSPKLSDSDGEIHTVVPGRPIGLHPYVVEELAKNKIHLHFYGDYTHGQWKEWIDKCHNLAPGYLHTHPNCSQDNWVAEFSKYDAGWLHFFKSSNEGDFAKANWDDLNYPARMATLAVAGLPMLQSNNQGHIVATYSLIKSLKMGIFFDSIDHLGEQLYNKIHLEKIAENVWKDRLFFSFDHHVDELINYFKEIIDKKKGTLNLDLDTDAA